MKFLFIVKSTISSRGFCICSKKKKKKKIWGVGARIMQENNFLLFSVFISVFILADVCLSLLFLSIALEKKKKKL